MRLVTSILVGAAGVAARFAASAQMAGFKMHALGVLLMVAGVAGVMWSMIFWTTWRNSRRSASAVSDRAVPASASTEGLLA